MCRQNILGGIQPLLGFFPPGFACFQIVQRAIILQPLRKILVQRRRSRQRFRECVDLLLQERGARDVRFR